MRTTAWLVWASSWIFVATVPACAKSLEDLVPFPCAEDGLCPAPEYVCSAETECVLIADCEAVEDTDRCPSGAPFYCENVDKCVGSADGSLGATDVNCCSYTTKCGERICDVGCRFSCAPDNACVCANDLPSDGELGCTRCVAAENFSVTEALSN